MRATIAATIADAATRAIEGAARLANHLLYTFFTTAWAATYYVAYWRNRPLLALVAFGLLIDLVRLDTRLCERIWSRLYALRVPLWLAFAVFAAGYAALVIKFDASDIAVGVAWLHYQQILLHSTPFDAQLVYATETIGICTGFAALVVYGIRQSAGATAFKRGPVKVRPRFPELLRLWFILIFLALTLVAWMIDPGRPSKTWTLETYNAKLLLALSGCPFLFAVAAKYWLLIIYLVKSDKADGNAVSRPASGPAVDASAKEAAS